MVDNNITIVFSGLKRQIREVLIATGLNKIIGEHNIFPNEDLALDAIYEILGHNESG